MIKNRVLVGMSGGVDSSVAAFILKERGYDVIGVTLQVWHEQYNHDRIRDRGCCSLSSVEDARQAANHIGIPFYVMNTKEVFKKKVVDYFIDEYLEGRTPNPCIACNRYIKFEYFLNKALELEAFYVATGHYADIEFNEIKQRYLLKKSRAVDKDQSYALYSLTQYQLEHALFPLSPYTKDQVRDIAKEIGLVTADKPDSQEICFVEDNNYARFIGEQINADPRPGNFVDTDGKVLGRHNGIFNYTIGQRKGLGVTFGKPMYVVAICPEKDQVVLGEHDEVFSQEMTVAETNFISIPSLKKNLRVNVKIRYSAPEVPATISPLGDGRVHVLFDKPERAITPGQAAVFYQGDDVLGGGTIEHKI
ncbi:MAG: tRNA 2-thiouridine(34) synthase MnmA [Clostridiales bacterium]|nr:tRNA 2-thiouridine(34) synthase MnmA [Clostridiales bacterium]